MVANVAAPGVQIPIEINPSNAVSGAGQIKGSLDQVGQAAVTARRLIRSMVVGLGGLSGVIATAFAVNQIAQFEDRMAAVRAVTGSTGREIQKLTELTRRLGATTVFTAKQAADAALFLSRAGFKTTETLQSLRHVLTLARAGGLDLAEAGLITADALRGFGLAAGEAGRVANTMALASARANTTVGELGQGLKFVAPVASAFGVSVETTVAALAKLSDAGLKATIAGTSLRRILSSLANPTGPAVKSLRALNIELDELDVASQGLIPVLRRMAEAGIGGEEAFELFGQRGGPGFLVLKSVIPGLERLEEELLSNQIAAQQMANIMDDTLVASFKAMISAASESILQLGDSGLTGTMRRMATSATGVLSAWNGMLDEFALGNDLTYEQAEGFRRLGLGIEATTKAVLALAAVPLTKVLFSKLIGSAGSTAGFTNRKGGLLPAISRGFLDNQKLAYAGLALGALTAGWTLLQHHNERLSRAMARATSQVSRLQEGFGRHNFISGNFASQGNPLQESTRLYEATVAGKVAEDVGKQFERSFGKIESELADILRHPSAQPIGGGGISPRAQAGLSNQQLLDSINLNPQVRANFTKLTGLVAQLEDPTLLGDNIIDVERALDGKDGLRNQILQATIDLGAAIRANLLDKGKTNEAAASLASAVTGDIAEFFRPGGKNNPNPNDIITQSLTQFAFSPQGQNLPAQLADSSRLATSTPANPQLLPFNQNLANVRESTRGINSTLEESRFQDSLAKLSGGAETLAKAVADRETAAAAVSIGVGYNAQTGEVDTSKAIERLTNFIAQRESFATTIEDPNKRADYQAQTGVLATDIGNEIASAGDVLANLNEAVQTRELEGFVRDANDGFTEMVANLDGVTLAEQQLAEAKRVLSLANDETTGGREREAEVLAAITKQLEDQRNPLQALVNAEREQLDLIGLTVPARRELLALRDAEAVADANLLTVKREDVVVEAERLAQARERIAIETAKDGIRQRAGIGGGRDESGLNAARELYNDGEINQSQLAVIEAQERLQQGFDVGTIQTFRDEALLAFADVGLESGNTARVVGRQLGNTVKGLSRNMAQATTQTILYGASFKDTFGALAKQTLDRLTEALIEYAIQLAIVRALGGVTSAGASNGSGGNGGGVGPGNGGRAMGGFVYGPGTGTSDSIMTFLSNGEYVVNAKSASRYGELLEAINSAPAMNAGGLVGGTPLPASTGEAGIHINVENQTGVEFDTDARQDEITGRIILTVRDAVNRGEFDDDFNSSFGVGRLTD